MIRNFVQWRLFYLLTLCFLVKVWLRFEARFENAQELLLLFREECVSFIGIKIEIVCFNLSKANFVVVNLRDTFNDKCNVRMIIHIHDLQKVCKTLINPVLLTWENSSLMHLVIVKRWFKANLFNPIRVFVPYSWKIFHLCVIKLTEKWILNWIQKFKSQFLWVFLNFHLLK